MGYDYWGDILVRLDELSVILLYKQVIKYKIYFYVDLEEPEFNVF